MPVEGGVGGHGDLGLDCESGGVFVGDERGDCLVLCRDGYDWLLRVGLGEGNSHGGLAGEDFCFSYAVAGEVAGVVDLQFSRAARVAVYRALQGLDFLVQGLDAGNEVRDEVGIADALIAGGVGGDEFRECGFDFLGDEAGVR